MSGNRWVSKADLEREGRVRLFCLPHAGSGAAGFHRWKRMLPEWVAVCPVMLPGRESRRSEPPFSSLEKLIDSLQSDVAERLGECPYAIFGHSLGALLGFAWARRIEQDRTRTPERLFCSGRQGPQFGRETLTTLEDKQLLERLAGCYGEEVRILMENREMRETFLPGLRADLQLVEDFRWEPGSSVRCPVSAYAGVADASVSEEGLRGWAEVSGPGFRMERLPRGHFYSFGGGANEVNFATGEGTHIPTHSLKSLSYCRGGSWRMGR